MRGTVSSVTGRGLLHSFTHLDVDQHLTVAKTLAVPFLQSVDEIAQRLALRVLARGTVLAVRPEHKVPGIPQESIREFRIGHNARQHHTPDQSRDDSVGP